MVARLPVVARFVLGCPFYLSLPVLWCQIRAGTGACPYGPPRRWGNPLWLPVLFVVARIMLPNQGRHGGLPLRSTPPLGQPPVVARLFVVTRIMVPNQGRHGGLPLRSNPRRGNPLWLPVLFVVARLFVVLRNQGRGNGWGKAKRPGHKTLLSTVISLNNQKILKRSWPAVKG